MPLPPESFPPSSRQSPGEADGLGRAVESGDDELVPLPTRTHALLPGALPLELLLPPVSAVPGLSGLEQLLSTSLPHVEPLPGSEVSELPKAASLSCLDLLPSPSPLPGGPLLTSSSASSTP